MSPRYLPVLVPVLALTVLSGCKLLKKKKAPTPDDDSSGSFTTSTSAGDFDAVNKADLSRFGDERKISAELGFVRQLVSVRTAPNEGGTAIGVIDPDKPVSKHAERLGYTLVTFDRPGATRKWAGWIPNEAFSSTAPLPGAAGTAAGTAAATATGTTVSTAPRPTTTAGTVTTPTTPSATATVAAASSLPETGTCNLTLRASGFSGSSSSCTFDEKVRSGPATLTFPCAGGTARATFSSHTFTGVADRQRVTISRVNTFDFKGCNFRTTQSITGTPPNLSYSYAEQILPGQGSKCAGMSTCTARASVSATP